MQGRTLPEEGSGAPFCKGWLVPISKLSTAQHVSQMLHTHELCEHPEQVLLYSQHGKKCISAHCLAWHEYVSQKTDTPRVPQGSNNTCSLCCNPPQYAI